MGVARDTDAAGGQAADATTTSAAGAIGTVGAAGRVDVVCARAREVSTAIARLLAAIVAVAGDAPAGYDADEVAFALAWTQAAARTQLEFGRYLTTTLPTVFTALARGDIDTRRAWVFYDLLTPVADTTAATIAGTILPAAGGLTTSQLRDRIRRAILKADPDAGTRTTKTVADRHLTCQPDRDGTATLLGVHLPAARATAAFERVDAYARGAKHHGDTRTLDQLRADTLLDLLEGVGITTAPVHRAGVIELTVPWTTATGAGNDPGLLAGHGPIHADIARDIIATHLPTPGGTDQTATPQIHWRHTLTTDDGALLHTTRIRVPESAATPPAPHQAPTRRTTRSRRQHDRRRAAGTSRPISPPAAAQPPVERNPTRRSPSVELARWIATRDRTCRAPGCQVPARAADIDHTIDHAASGPTSHENLAIICRHHHRLKHEAGWHVTQPQPGILVWTSPHGHTYRRTTDPP